MSDNPRCPWCKSNNDVHSSSSHQTKPWFCWNLDCPTDAFFSLDEAAVDPEVAELKQQLTASAAYRADAEREREEAREDLRMANTMRQQFEQELTAAKAELATAKEILGAFKRRHEDRYLQWTFAGGVNDCKHGFGEGIPCPKCDLKTIIDYVDAATAQTGKQKGVKE